MDAIDEIQSKKRREAGLNAWAEMLERMYTRPPAQAVAGVEECGGGAGLPRDTMLRQNPKIAEERKLKLQEIKADIARLQAEAQKLQDKVEVKKAEAATETPKAQVTPTTTHTPEAAPKQAVAPSKHAAPTAEASPAEIVQHQQEVAREEAQAEVAQAQGPVDTHEVEQVTQLVNQSGLTQPAVEDQVESAEGATSDIEEALRLMQLKGGQGANPALAAKDYVLASELPGVKDTLTGGVFEDFRVAL
ncbi:hypothetical protein JST97_33630 [bacterium]|nr:hypothetical protein [bacterium]